jgi:hypothetical protein
MDRGSPYGKRWSASRRLLNGQMTMGGQVSKQAYTLAYSDAFILIACALRSRTNGRMALDLRCHRDDCALLECVRFDCSAFSEGGGAQSSSAHPIGAAVPDNAAFRVSSFYRAKNRSDD